MRPGSQIHDDPGEAGWAGLVVPPETIGRLTVAIELYRDGTTVGEYEDGFQSLAFVGDTAAAGGYPYPPAEGRPSDSVRRPAPGPAWQTPAGPGVTPPVWPPLGGAR